MRYIILKSIEYKKFVISFILFLSCYFGRFSKFFIMWNQFSDVKLIHRSAEGEKKPTTRRLRDVWNMRWFLSVVNNFKYFSKFGVSLSLSLYLLNYSPTWASCFRVEFLVLRTRLCWRCEPPLTPIISTAMYPNFQIGHQERRAAALFNSQTMHNVSPLPLSISAVSHMVFQWNRAFLNFQFWDALRFLWTYF